MPRLPLLAAILLSLVAADTADAQIWRRARDAAQRGAERAVERQAEERARRAADAAIDGLFDAGEEAARCVFTDETCIREAQGRGESVVLTDADGAPVDRSGAPVTADNASDAVVRSAPGTGGAASGAASASARPGDGAWANYDFVPGDRPLLIEDFESSRVGDVPRRVDFHEGVMEVVSEGGNQMLRFADASAIAFPLPETLPERFTIEFEVYSADDWNSVVLGTGPLTEADGDYSCFHGDLRGHQAAEFRVGSFFETGVSSATGGSSLQNQSAHEEGMVPVRIAVDGSYVKMYVGENRVANVPNADVQRTNRLLVTACGELAATDDERSGPVLIDNLRVAAGGRESIYDRLQADGRLALGGLLFDTASATLRPESTPTLQDLVRTLQQNPALRLRVEGHTDDRGAADANRRLSEQRAQSVVAWLTGEGVAANRLEAVGVGPERPVASNDTAEGRAQNRRVEVVRL
ncbi:OmpA family protein [Rubrivirga sp. IMCC43871]|uniref:OmpA family protein n=1 Tax=Rubrivirga sp. IMCC43871 TaxID=3391575 RepID=UPI00398F8FA4